MPAARSAFLVLALAIPALLTAAPGLAAPKAKAGAAQSGPAWPGADWAAAPLPASVDKAKVDAAARSFDAADKTLGQTQTLIIVQGGKLIYERYAPGIEADTRQNSWGIAAAITQSLIGRAVATGAVKSIDEAMFQPEWRMAADGREKITFRQLLTMTAGLHWTERNAGRPADSDAELMVFDKGGRNILEYAVGKTLGAKPGERFLYSSGNSVLLSAGLQRRLPALNNLDGRRTYALKNFMDAEFFGKLGMSTVSPEFDIVGNFQASDFVYASGRDFARLGLFWLRDGQWGEERLLPEGWMDFARTAPAAKHAGAYGAGFWIKAKGDAKQDPLMAALPDDAFAAGGERGAALVMVPSKDLVILRLGITPWGEHSRKALGAWLGDLVAAFPDAAPAP